MLATFQYNIETNKSYLEIHKKASSENAMGKMIGPSFNLPHFSDMIVPGIGGFLMI